MKIITKRIKSRNSLKQKTFCIFLLIIVCIIIFSFILLPACKSENEKITGEQLSGILKGIDEDVSVSREKVDELEQLEKKNFKNITANEILESISSDFQYSSQEQTTEEFDLTTADFIDGRKVMITRFKIPGKIESFYLQFQSTLYNQGYNFEDRLKYSDLCNSFINEEKAIKAYLLKRENYFIVLIK